MSLGEPTHAANRINKHRNFCSDDMVWGDLLGLTCSEYSNAKNCNSRGVVDAGGSCTCKPGYTGSACQYATDPKHCNNLGSVLSDGICDCQSGVTGQYCQCVSPNPSSGTCLECATVAGPYSPDTCTQMPSTVCNGRSLSAAPESDTWCRPCADQQAAGNVCQYARATTCSGNGSPKFDGSCTCDAEFAGNACQYARATTCSGNGSPTFNGVCTCDTGYSATSNCKLCLDRFTGTSANKCDRCQNKYAQFSYPLCNVDACISLNTQAQDATSKACVCNVGWYGARCECYKGIGVTDAESAPCTFCAVVTSGPEYRLQNLGTCTVLTTSTTANHTTIPPESFRMQLRMPAGVSLREMSQSDRHALTSSVVATATKLLSQRNATIDGLVYLRNWRQTAEQDEQEKGSIAIAVITGRLNRKDADSLAGETLVVINDRLNGVGLETFKGFSFGAVVSESAMGCHLPPTRSFCAGAAQGREGFSHQAIDCDKDGTPDRVCLGTGFVAVALSASPCEERVGEPWQLYTGPFCGQPDNVIPSRLVASVPVDAQSCPPDYVDPSTCKLCQTLAAVSELEFVGTCGLSETTTPPDNAEPRCIANASGLVQFYRYAPMGMFGPPDKDIGSIKVHTRFRGTALRQLLVFTLTWIHGRPPANVYCSVRWLP